VVVVSFMIAVPFSLGGAPRGRPLAPATNISRKDWESCRLTVTAASGQLTGDLSVPLSLADAPRAAIKDG
jgi:hypothetical protein